MESKGSVYNFEELSKLVAQEAILMDVFELYVVSIPGIVTEIKNDFQSLNSKSLKTRLHQIRPFFVYASAHSAISILDEWRNLESDSMGESYYLHQLKELETEAEQIILFLMSRIRKYHENRRD